MNIKKVRKGMTVKIADNIDTTLSCISGGKRQKIKFKGRIGKVIAYYKIYQEVYVDLGKKQFWFHSNDIIDIHNIIDSKKSEAVQFNIENLIT